MRKILGLVSLTLLGLVSVASASSEQHFEMYQTKSLKAPREVKKGHFGNTEITEISEENGVNKMVKEVYPNYKPFTRDYERQTRALHQAILQDKVNKERMTTDRIFTCDNRGNVNEFNPDDAGYFIPVSVGALNGEQNSITYTAGKCFKNITFSLDQALSEDRSTGDITVNIDTENSSSLFCSDWFFFATSQLQHIETFYLSGKHQVTFKGVNADTIAEIQENGLRVYMFCDGYVDTFKSVYNTALAFYGGLGTDPNDPMYGSHVPEYME